MGFTGVILTKKKWKMAVFCIDKKAKKLSNFAKNEVLKDNWCKNYTIGNLTNR